MGEETKPQKRRKKPLVVIGTIVVVVALLGVGFFVWHNQPSFCNAICHVPMDPDLPTYEATPGHPAIDKRGREVADAAGMMAAVHRVAGETAGKKIDCLACHVPTISQQIEEGIAWISGKYVVFDNATYGGILSEHTLAELAVARGVEGDAFCLNPDCHDMTRDDLAQLTAQYTINPHAPQHGDIYCDLCHKAHRASTNYCSQCHKDTPIPEGWLSYQEFQALQ